jgi:coproporphyrinogen III oxidase
MQQRKYSSPLPAADPQKDLSQVTDSDPMRLRMEAFVKSQQKRIVSALESLEPKARFKFDHWTRPEGGDGVSAVLQDGQVFEKAGVMVSVVHGTLGPAAVEKMRADHSKIQNHPSGKTPFFACGLSLVIHPVNPHAPTVHMNYRYFEIQNADGTLSAWFGGGTGSLFRGWSNGRSHAFVSV